MSPPVSEFQTGTYSATSESTTPSMTFSDDDTFTIASNNGELAVHGTYKVMGDQFEIRDDGGAGACLGDLKVETYTWKLEGKALTFTKAEDPCDGRADTLTSLAWEAE